MSSDADLRAENEALRNENERLTLRARNRELVEENHILREENEQLKVQLGAAIAATNGMSRNVAAYHDIRATVLRHEEQERRRREFEAGQREQVANQQTNGAEVGLV